MLKEKARPCSELSEKVLNEMCSDGYSPKSVEHHVRPIYNRLAEYCEEHFEGMYSVNAGKAFIQMIQRKSQSKEQTDLNRNSIECHSANYLVSFSSVYSGVLSVSNNVMVKLKGSDSAK